MVEGFIDGCLVMLNVKLEMDLFIENFYFYEKILVWFVKSVLVWYFWLVIYWLNNRKVCIVGVFLFLLVLYVSVLEREVINEWIKLVFVLVDWGIGIIFSFEFIGLYFYFWYSG